MKKKLKLFALEPRVLLDAAAATTAVEVYGDSAQVHDAFLESQQATEPDLSVEQNPIFAGNSILPGEQQESSVAFTELSGLGASDVVVIDSSIKNYQDLMVDLPPDVQLIILESGEDGLQQILDDVRQRTDISSLHVFSHGSEGSLVLGNTILDSYSLETNRAVIQQIGQSLSAGGDILLYGCNVGANDAGIAFVSKLAVMTGADVAASDDLTGAAEFGGDWDLEVRSGSVESSIVTTTKIVEALAAALDLATADHNGDAIADPLRMITWNVIGLDSNKPATEGPSQFMVGIRVETGATAYTAADKLVVKIVDDDGIDIFSSGYILADFTASAADFDDGVDNIKFVNRTAYTDVEIAANSYKDFYFNIDVERLLSSHNQIQPFHFEVFKDANGDQVWTGAVDSDGNGSIDTAGAGAADESGLVLNKFSWLNTSAANVNTPLYMYVEKYISQARNDVNNQTLAGGDDSIPAIRIEGYMNASNQYDSSPITVFVGQTLKVRTEGETATQGYPQMSFSTVIDVETFQIQSVKQAYNKPLTTTDYQQDFGTGTDAAIDSTPLDGSDLNTTIYANAAGWNPTTHSLMITSAPPSAGGGPMVADYELLVTGTGGGKLQTLILDYSGSSFHYNADANTGVEGVDFVRYNAVQGAVQGNVGVDTNGDKRGDVNLAGVTITLTGDVDGDGDSDTLITTTDASGNYRFSGYWKNAAGNVHTSTNSAVNPGGYTWYKGVMPATYTVTESATPGYGNVIDYANGVSDGVNDNVVTVTLDKNSTVITEGGVQYAVAVADFVEGQVDLQLSKSVNTTAPALGGNVTYTLTVTNTSIADAGAVEVTEKLPTGLTYVSNTGTYNPATGIWTVGAVAAGASKSIDITATVTSADPISNFAEITLIQDGSGNTMLDSDSTAGNNKGADAIYGTSDDGSRTPFEDDEARVTIDASEADLSVITTVSNPNPAVGDTVTFTISVTNSGPDAATGVVVTDSYPSGINPATVTQTSITAGTFTTATGVWNVTNGSGAPLANGATAVLTFTAVIDEAAAFSNYVEITAADQYDPDSLVTSNRSVDDKGDGIADDDEASALVTPQAADLSLAKVVSTTTPDVNSNITYTLLLNNAGPNNATGVTVVDTLPAGLQWVSGGTADAGATAGTGGTVTWSGININNGETQSMALVVKVLNSNALTSVAQITSSSLPDPDSVPSATINGVPTTNGGTGADDLGDGITDDDEASITVTPGATDLSLYKSYVVDDGALNTLGETVTFTLTVLNSGPKDAYNVRVVDYLPANLTFVPGSVTGTGTFDGTTWDLDAGATALASGSSASMSFKATVNSLFSLTNFAEITEVDALATDAQDGVSTLSDLDSTPNNDGGAKTANEDDEASLTLPSIPYADLQLTNVVSNSAPAPGSLVTFTLKVTNTGNADASGVEVKYVYPDTEGANKELKHQSAVGTGTNTWDGANDVGTWSIGSLAYGETATLTITARVPTGSGGDSFSSDLSVFAQVTASSLPDPDSTVSNNAGTDATVGTVDDGTRTPYEDDEAIATVVSPTSTRIDVAISESVVVNGGAKTATSTLVVGDTVTYTVTAINQGGDADNPVIFDAWPTSLLTLNSLQQNAADGTISYSIDNGATWTDFNNTTSNTINLATVTHLKWDPSNSGASTKFKSATTATLTITGTVTAAGAASNNITNSAWWNDAGSGTDADSAFPQAALPTTNDLATDDLTDGVKDDDETILTIGGSQSADLSLTKQVSLDGGQTYFNSAAMAQNDVATFKIVVTNDAASGSAATNVSVADVLPTGFVYQNYYGDGSYNSGTGTWTIGTIDKGASATLYIVGRADWTLTGGATSLTNYTQVTAVDQADPDSTKNNNSTTEDDDASVVITKTVPGADLSLIKTVNNASPVVGGSVTFNLTVVNSGPNAATGVVVTDTLPAGFTYTGSAFSGSATGDTFNSGTGIWSLGNVGVGEIHTLTITGTVTSSAPITNFAEITASDLSDPDSTVNNDGGAKTANEDDEAAVTVTPQTADLSLTKSVDNATPNVGDTINFTLTVINAGLGATTGVTVKDTLPGNFNYTGFTVSGTSAGDTFDGGTGVWTLGNVGVGEVHSITITGTVTSGAVMNNFAEITASSVPDPDSTVNNDGGARTASEDDEAIVSVRPVSADLSLNKSVSNASPNVGDNVTFTLSVTNAGPNDATGVVVKDYLPAGMTWVSGGSNAAGTVTWNVGNVAIGETKTLNIVATVNSAAALTNFAEITASDQADPDSTVNNDGGAKTTNEDDEASVVVDARQIDLKIATTASKTAPNVGEVITLYVTVTNEGSDDATGIKVEDILPAGMTYVAASASDGGTESGGTVSWSGINLTAGSIKVVSFQATVNSGAVLTNTAQITAADQPDVDSVPSATINGVATVNGGIAADDLGDTIADDDEATVQINGQQVDLSLSKSVSVTSSAQAVTDGYYTATFTLTVSNAAGFEDATNVVVKDKLPAGLGYISDTGSGAYNSTTGTWTVGSVAAGASKSITIVAKVLNAGVLVNYAQVSASDLPDIDSTVNNGTAPTVAEDDEASASVDVAMIDLSVTQTIDNPTPTAGATVVYTITLTNGSGFDTATGINVKETLPTGISVTSIVPSTGTYNSGTNIWSPANLAAGASATLTVTGTVTDVNKLTSVAEVTAATEFDIDSTPNNGYTTADAAGEDDYAIVSPNMGKIYGKVLDDADGYLPGGFDPGDSGLSGLTVTLYASSDPGLTTPLQTTTTDSTGSYSFYAAAGS